MAALPLSPDSARANPIPPFVDSNRDAVRAAPRVPAGRDSLAALAQPAASVAAFSPAYARRQSPSALLADMLDTLQDCVTEPQLRAWHSATTEFRASLPEMLLERIERQRRTQQQVITEERRRQLIAGRIAQARSLRTLAQDHRPALLAEISGAMNRHRMAETTFGKLALRDGAFVGDLRRGRGLRPATAIKVRAFIAMLDAREGC